MRKLYLAALPLVLLFAAFASNLGRQATEPPADLAELVAAAEADGLFWTTGARNVPSPNQSLSVVVSATPITCDQVNLLNVSYSPAWKGKAKAYARQCPSVGSDAPYMAFCGDMLVIGDPELVARVARLSRPR
jgi:hypothetical protein